MPIPATIGQLRSKISDMQIGDYVKCWYSFHKTNGSLSDSPAGILVGLGTDTFSTAGEKPVTGESTTYSSKFFYFVKVAKGLLIADRVCQHSISWDVLNAGKVIQGKPYSFSTSANISQGCASSENISGILRSLTGGVAYADANENKTLDARLSNGTCFPVNNEYDKYFMGFPQSMIKDGYTVDDVFHYKVRFTTTQDTTMTGSRISSTGTIEVQDNTWRVGRGSEDNFPIWKGLGMSKTSIAYESTGFRPVFEYREV